MKPLLILLAVTSFSLTSLAAETRFGVQNRVSEWVLHSAKAHADPFNDLEVDVVITDPQGKEERVPAFWAGDLDWRIRYMPHATGLD